MQDLWKPRRRIEQQFFRALNRISSRMSFFFETYNDTDELQAALIDFARSRVFQKAAEAAALRMVTGLFSDHGRTWRQAAAHNSKGREIYRALQKELDGKMGAKVNELVAQNAALIKTLPQNIAQDVARYIERETFKGRRPEFIEDEIRRKFPDHTRAKAKLIARTQTAMTHTDLIRARSENFGRDWYVWRAVGGGKGDGRTRPAHKGISGVICSWREPPAPEQLFPTYTKTGLLVKSSLGHYHPGQCPNCRCYPQVIIDLDLVDFPARVYSGGRITTMSRRQFDNWSGMR